MSSFESLGTVTSTDILIIGGGIAGLSAAVTAKEAAPELDILVVDKATASKGYAGKAGRTAGLLSFVTPEDDPEEFVRYCLDNVGYYLNDQLLLREFAYASRNIAERLSLWGVDVPRDENGKIAYAKWPFPWGTASIDPDMCISIASYARNLGVRFIDKIAVVDLLKDNNRISGAVGFNHLDGSCQIFKAKAVILANGSQNYDVTELWCSTGNGTAAAYRAGAEMRNAEFGNMCDFARVDPRGWIYYGVHGGAHIAHDHLHNVHGENISQKYRPGLHSSMDPQAALAWYNETVAGNGPISVDLSEFDAGKFFKFHPKALEQMHKEEVKANFPETKKFDVVPGFIGELSCVRVDPQMATSVPGLFAAGDISGSGSARGGANPTPPAKIHGTGILNALFMGMKAGPSAVIHARAVTSCCGVDDAQYDQARMLKGKIFYPLTRKDGISPRALIAKIQDAIAPVDLSVIKSGKRMDQALEQILAIRSEMGQMKAQDHHELAKCIDAESMVLCAELFYRASLARTESRGFHCREDYPSMDNDTWLKWIIVKDVNGEMNVSTEDIPIHRYPYKPIVG